MKNKINLNFFLPINVSVKQGTVFFGFSKCSDLFDQCVVHSFLTYLKTVSHFIGMTAQHFLDSFYEFMIIIIFRDFIFTYSIPKDLDIFSLVSVFRCSNWLEREIFDLFGIVFTNHPDLRRLLTDYGFRGFPLRKDFPVYGFKELWYDSEFKLVSYRSLRFSQSVRNYIFIKQWK